MQRSRGTTCHIVRFENQWTDAFEAEGFKVAYLTLKLFCLPFQRLETNLFGSALRAWPDTTHLHRATVYGEGCFPPLGSLMSAFRRMEPGSPPPKAGTSRGLRPSWTNPHLPVFFLYRTWGRGWQGLI